MRAAYGDPSHGIDTSTLDPVPIDEASQGTLALR